jgi:putative ABC transport system substrate-binding protein
VDLGRGRSFGEAARLRHAARWCAATSVVWPLASRAQQGEQVRRIGVLLGYPEGDPQAQANVIALRKGLKELGWIEGHNVQLDLRWAGGSAEKARNFAKELIGMASDVIVPSTNQVTAIVQQETRTTPVVFAFVGDPVGSGFVENLARPGGNITGFANFENSIGGKWVEILREIAPSVKRAGFIFSPEAAPNVGFFHAAEHTAPSLRIELAALAVHTGNEIEQRIAKFAAEPDGGLIIAPHVVTVSSRELIASLALRYRLPAVYSDRYFAESGGLISFGNNTADLFRRAASYIDRILKGAKPADLPVQLPTKFEMVINLKTAKVLGITIPAFLLQNADDVIE